MFNGSNDAKRKAAVFCLITFYILQQTNSSPNQSGWPDHRNNVPAFFLTPSLTNYNNETSDEIISTSVLYYGLNGFGITWIYFITNVVLLIVAGIGLFLNVLALKIVSIKSPLHDASHHFISNLAMSDLSLVSYAFKMRCITLYTIKKFMNVHSGLA